MAYCTQTDIADILTLETLIRLTDDEGAGIVDAARVAKAIEDADAEIDGYCGEKYSLPLSPVPVIIRKASVDIAIYNLYSRRQGAPEDRKQRYDNTIKLLREIAKGTVTLGAGSPAAETSDAPEFSSQERIFTRDKMKGF
jgi:phage gp36-like protein